MEGSITARTLDYFGLLVAASVGALCSALLTAICVKFEGRRLTWFWAILLWFCTARRVLFGEVAVKSGMTELEQALEALGRVSRQAVFCSTSSWPVLHIDGVKTLICWERLVLAQLVED